MQQIYRRTPMPKCAFHKVAWNHTSASNIIEITLRHGCSSVNLLHIFRTSFPKNTSGWLLLNLYKVLRLLFEWHYLLRVCKFLMILWTSFSFGFLKRKIDLSELCLILVTHEWFRACSLQLTQSHDYSKY